MTGQMRKAGNPTMRMPVTVKVQASGRRTRARRVDPPPGFTLVEMIVVVAIVGVLAGMIVPRLTGASGATKLRVPARQLLALARYARDYAATRCCRCRLRIDRSARCFGLLRPDEDGDADDFRPLKSPAGRPITLPPNVRFGQVRIADSPDGTEQRDAITFHPDGSGDGAIVEITDGRHTYSLVVLPDTGRLRLIEGRVNEPPTERIDLDA